VEILYYDGGFVYSMEKEYNNKVRTGEKTLVLSKSDNNHDWDDDDDDDDDDDGSYSCNLSAAMLLFKLAMTKVSFICLSLCSI